MNPLLSRLWPGRLVVTFHGIGTPARTLDAGEAPYWVEAPVLAAAIDLAAKGRLEITFDDGNESDARIALPMLQRAGVTATFFVLAGRLDKPGSLSRTQLQELARAGMAIGSHGHDHVDWTRADDTDLRRELWDSRAAIEDCLGAPVDSVSVPFGAFDARVLRLVAQAGYRHVHTSSGTLAPRQGWLVPRHTIRQDTRLAQAVEAWTSWRARLVSALRNELRGHKYRFSTSTAGPGR
ncbi:MAG TPA: polysaccharide deacetylase family protein [Geminicoccus sp.]|uniref:polysaccharide deacetylase family protein n=1 Tax=Geminicoccus sp. TaxID=2024832 RepID=UPI002C93C9A6|nr:polysaccharide deacetylase family protein [Geminicoccus sp.]HWL71424.1 polysaccharide deacetylase family protein [Geminicoccus sp.]